VELAHVNGKVLELVLLGLLEDQLAALAHGVDAAQVARGVEGRVGGFGGGARGPQRAVARVGLGAAGRDDGLGAFAAEDSHDGDGEGRLQRRAVWGALADGECRATAGRSRAFRALHK
jgi:hypothetical protein